MSEHRTLAPISEQAEVWADVPGYEGYYQVSDQGRVRSLSRWVPCRRYRKGRVVPGQLRGSYADREGYLRLLLYKNDRGKNWFVHTLVLMAFVGPRPKDMEACHFPDADPANNRLGNLRWGTRTENIQDAVIHGSYARNPPRAKLTRETAYFIRQLWGEGGISAAALACRFNVHCSQIYRIVRGEIWK